VEAPAVFVYDGHPGGVGLAEGAYGKAEALLEATLHLISDCPCEEGCPSCVHSPKCGSGNKPLDKAAAVTVLEIMLGRQSLAAGGAEAPPQTTAEAPAEAPPAPLPDDPWAGRRVVVFDLETQRSAADVGGWNRANLMRVSVGVAWDSASNRFTAYREEEVEELLALLEAADLVVGFNSVRFDYAVLSGYTPRRRLDDLATFDILAHIYETYEFRIGLDKLGTHTLDRGKTADGLQALAWWKEGRLEELTEYCRQDVELTRDLFLFGLREGYLLYERKGVKVRLPVEWDVADLVRKAKTS
jgi:DEAD/DEAH box helicase domain-containing protein